MADQELKEYFKNTIRDALGEQPTRYFDASRIPLICKSIMDIHENIRDIKEMMQSNKKESDEQHEKFLTKESFDVQFNPIKTVVFGAIGVALLSIAGALISIVVK